MKGIPRYAAKRDSSEQAIVTALNHVGFQAIRLSMPGMPDLIVNGDNRQGCPDSWFFEIKTKSGHLTDKQQEVLKAWTGKPIQIIHTVEEALQAVGF